MAKRKYTPEEKMTIMNKRCWWVVLHSFLYYELDTNIISDAVFDRNAKKLKAFLDKNPKLFKKSEYYYCMHDFNGKTGFEIPGRLTDKHKEKAIDIAKFVLHVYWAYIDYK